MRRDAALAEPAGPSSEPDTTARRHVRLHASCVHLGGRGVLLLGPPGSGKSDLALRLIDGGAELVADDQLLVERAAARLIARPPATLAGLLEVRGIGILRLPHRAEALLDLAVRLLPSDDIARLPEPAVHPLLGIELPCVHLDPRAASAAAAVRMTLSAERVA